MTDITGIGSVLDFGGKIIDRLWPDKAQADAAKFELFKLQQSGELQVMQIDAGLAQAQIKVNEVEAASSNVFVAGWRPFLGWTCGAAYALKFFIGPLGAFILTASGYPVVMPDLDFSDMAPLLFGMLGLGAFRTVEKIRGVA